MKNIKQIWKDHKTEIVIGGLLLTGVIISIVVASKIGTKNVMDLPRKNVISWTPDDKFMNLERVKELLDLNANNSESFAIFREGLISTDYSFITLSDNIVDNVF